MLREKIVLQVISIAALSSFSGFRLWSILRWVQHHQKPYT